MLASVRRLRCVPTLLAVLLAGATAGAAWAATAASIHPALWPRATWPLPVDAALEQRVAALMAKMTLEEKVGQLIQADILSVTPDDVRTYHLGAILAGGNSKPGGAVTATVAQWQALSEAYYRAAMAPTAGHVAIPLLFGVDAVHGHNNVVGATLFPQNVGLGATHDADLIRQIGEATAAEVRATGINWSFAPTLAVPQDVRWGRSYEGYSQDPKLVASYAGAMVEGLQGKVGTPRFLDDEHVVASAKHFLGDGGTLNGKDQGDAQISEAALRDVHAAGYPPAVEAGVQTIMASFSSWNGEKMHGNRALLTDVLKQRMGFQGFVVGDWNAHGQVPGCTNEDCPVAINAGLDMLMAPDSWRGLYEDTLAEAKAGTIPMSRLDDAVARILRVKFRAGLFEQGAPSAQTLVKNATSVVGSPAHRALARRAVRESLVLLKNDGGLLPLDPRKHVLIAGDAADSVPRQSGGWTLNWQGTGLKSSDFPGAQTIGAGIVEQVRAAGGQAWIDADGRYTTKPDVAAVVFGEDPYAEFQGDLPNLLYRAGDDHDLALLRRLRSEGIPVVAVFLSGRPLWVNREINAANAFVAAWLPGSEGGGVADVLLRTPDGQIAHDFHGTLAFAWPRTAVAGEGAPQFALGYGLRYGDQRSLPPLLENSGIQGEQIPVGHYLDRGKPIHGYAFVLVDAQGQTVPADVSRASTADGALQMSGMDYRAQEDARQFHWQSAGGELVIQAHAPLDLDRQTNGDVLLVTTLRVDALPSGDAWIAMGCGRGCQGRVSLARSLAALPRHTWMRLGVPLKCFRGAGADMHRIDQPFVMGGGQGSEWAVTRVALGTEVDQVVDCPR